MANVDFRDSSLPLPVLLEEVADGVTSKESNNLDMFLPSAAAQRRNAEDGVC